MSLESNVVSLYKNAYQCILPLPVEKSFTGGKCCRQLLDSGTSLLSRFPTLAPVLHDLKQLKRKFKALSRAAKSPSAVQALNVAKQTQNPDERYLQYACILKENSNIPFVYESFTMVGKLLAQNLPHEAEQLVPFAGHDGEKILIEMTKAEISVRGNIPNAIQMLSHLNENDYQSILPLIHDVATAFGIVCKMNSPDAKKKCLKVLITENIHNPEIVHLLNLCFTQQVHDIPQFLAAFSKPELAALIAQEIEHADSYTPEIYQKLLKHYISMLMQNNKIDLALELLPRAVSTDSERASIAESLQNLDANKAFQVAMGITDPREQSIAIYRIIIHVAKMNPTQALEYIGLVADERMRRFTYYEVLSRLAQFREELDTAIQFAAEIEQESPDIKWFWKICENLCAHDPDTAATLMAHYKSHLGKNFTHIFLIGFTRLLVDVKRPDLANGLLQLIKSEKMRIEAEMAIKSGREVYDFAEFIEDQKKLRDDQMQHYPSLNCNPTDAFAIVDQSGCDERRGMQLYKIAGKIAARAMSMSQVLDLVRQSALWHRPNPSEFHDHHFESIVVEARPLNNICEGFELLPKLRDASDKVSVYLKIADLLLAIS